MNSISVLAIAAASIAVSALGGVWFALLFARPYAAFLGRSAEPPRKPAALFFIGPAVCMLVTTIASAMLMNALRVDTIGEAVKFGATVGVGLLASTAVNMGLNPNIPRPIAYGLLSAGYFVTSSVVISVILFLLSA